ncbi:MAG: ABC transporter [bacterium (Candidatus Stahlbacteria) CG23_combo_of_CG06-09_8_20_14_all_34_7]|nr:MAG: ABC transporter [bacterium (Candidatus Stahlbacteria) CG23_combo_of_CG06-09_8_20_14_all_34_7]
MSKNVLSISHVFLTRDNQRVLEDVNLDVNENELISILGPNGSGKTTLLKAILGFQKIDSGSIKIFGENPENGRSKVGYIPQFIERNSDFPLSIRDIILYGRYTGSFVKYKEEDFNIVNRYIEEFSLSKLRNKKISELSGGEIQRVLMARSLVRNPKLLLLDEPTSSVDKKSQEEFFAILNRLKENMAILLVTHDLGAVSTYIKRIVCLNRTVNYDGPTAEGLSKLDETYKGSINIIDHIHHIERKNV